MRIEAIELITASLPLRRSFVHARGSRETSEVVFVVIEDDTGGSGWGEVLPRPYVTGESVASVMEVSAPACAARLLGQEFRDMAQVAGWLEAEAGTADRTMATMCGFDLALLDLAGHRFGIELGGVLGGERFAPLPAGVVIGFEIATAALARHCAALRFGGRRHVKVKVGQPDDAERLSIVAGVLGDVPLRIDANMAWSVEEAVERLLALAALPIASIEQPVAAGDLRGMKTIRERTGIPVMADESVCSFADLERVIAAGAADIVNVRLGKMGGLLASHRLVARARSAGLGVNLGTMVGETGVLSRAGEIFGRCVPGFACLDGKGQNGFLLEEDILVPPESATAESTRDGRMGSLAGGLGVAVSRDRVLARCVGEPRRFTHRFNSPGFNSPRSSR